MKTINETSEGTLAGLLAESMEPSVLYELLKKASEQPYRRRRKRNTVSISEITQVPHLFQPREVEVDPNHVADLVRVIGPNRQRLDPVLVWQCGEAMILLDGHHRLAAYNECRMYHGIPVECFYGSIEDAVKKSGTLNGKTFKPMNGTERNNYAWRLVRLGKLSKAQEREASGVSDGQIGHMRRIKKQMIEKGVCPDDYLAWLQALKWAKDDSTGEDGEFDAQAWLNQKAANYADKMAKLFSTKLSKDPELMALTLEHYMGRNAGRLAEIMLGHIDTEDLKLLVEDGDF